MQLRLIYEYTWLTWAWGPQMIGFSMAHAFPFVLMLGWLGLLGCVVWFPVALLLIARRRFAMSVGRLVIVSGVALCLVVPMVPPNGWATAASQILGASPRINELLSSACLEGDVNRLEFLLGEGADPDSVSLRAGLPIELAARAGHEDVVRLLIRQRVQIDRMSPNGNTALHAAAEAGHDRIVGLLLDAGADPTKPTASGSNAATKAALGGHDQLANYLDERTRVYVKTHE